MNKWHKGGGGGGGGQTLSYMPQIAIELQYNFGKKNREGVRACSMTCLAIMLSRHEKLMLVEINNIEKKQQLLFAFIYMLCL